MKPGPVQAVRTIVLAAGDAALEQQVRAGAQRARIVVTADAAATVAAVRREEPCAILHAVGAASADRDLASVAELVRLVPATPVLAIVDTVPRELALRALEAGAGECLVRPVRAEEFAVALQRMLRVGELAAAALRGRRADDPLPGMIAVSEPMRALCATVRRLAPGDVDVLISGETGTGKELVARALHALGPRAAGPFVAIACAALPDGLLDAELFGVERGAYGAGQGGRPGRIEQAHGGTLFLDGIEALSPAAQTRFLRVLQARSVQRLGAHAARTIELRVLSSSSAELTVRIADGSFRADLFFRVCGAHVQVPGLRERRACIVPLARHFLAGVRPGARFDAGALAAMQAWEWPGNVRELSARVRAAAAESAAGAVTAAQLGLAEVAGAPQAWLALDVARRGAETAAVRDAWVRSGGEPELAAARLGISRDAVDRLLRRSRDARRRSPPARGSRD